MFMTERPALHWQRAPFSVLVNPERSCSSPQDKPYAFFGTCLGAVTAHEAIHAIQRHGTGPLPLAFFPAAVSPPHIYAQAVAQLYVAPGEDAQSPDMMAGVLHKLRGWRALPRELIMQVGPTAPCLLG